MTLRHATWSSVVGLPILAALIILGCVTNDDSGSGSDSSCGAALTGNDWTSTCQSWTNQYCCDQLSACAGEQGCAYLLSCIDACPSPRDADCITTCQGNVPSDSISELNTLADCTKNTPSNGPAIPATCSWP